MFGLLKKFNSITKTVNSNFNDTFSAINESKKIIEEKLENKQDNYSNLFEQAKNLIFSFLDSENANYLQKSASIFMDLTHIKSNEVEPYFYLAYIFHLMNENSFALEYIKIVNSINSEFEGLESLKNNVLSTQNEIKNKEIKVETQKVMSFSNHRTLERVTRVKKLSFT